MTPNDRTIAQSHLGIMDSPWLQWVTPARTIPKKSKTRGSLRPEVMFAPTSSLSRGRLQVIPRWQEGGTEGVGG